MKPPKLPGRYDAYKRMSHLLEGATLAAEPINLIRVFGFYLAMMFLISLLRRWDIYVDTVRLLFAVRGRWPKLVQRLSEHRGLLLNWSFFRPAVLSLILTLIQMTCSRVIWPQALLTWDGLTSAWWWIVAVALPLIPMLAVDGYFILRVGRFDRHETEKYLDMAENWLGWKGPLVRMATLGYVNPQRMVDDEVKKNLVELRQTMNSSLYWVSLQITLRVVFGLTLWTVWALHTPS